MDTQTEKAERDTRVYEVHTFSFFIIFWDIFSLLIFMR